MPYYPSYISTIPAFSVHKNNVDQTGIVTNTLTKVTWSTEGFDTNNNFASDKFTPTIAGIYLFVCPILWVNTTGDQVELLTAIYKNGAIGKTARMLTSGANLYQGPLLVCVVDMNGSTDYVEIYARHLDVANRDIYGADGSTWWAGYWVAP